MTSICHITTAHPANDVRIFDKQCRSLAAAGYQVHLVAHGELRSSDSVQFHSLGRMPTSRFQRAALATSRAAEMAISTGAAIAHLHDPEMLTQVPKLRRAGMRVVYDAHEDLPRQVLMKAYVPKMVRPLVSASVEWLEQRFVAKATAVVGATEVIVQRFKPKVPCAAVVKNYPRLERFSGIAHPKRAADVVYAGAITEARGALTMLAVIGHCRGVRLRLAGVFESEGLEAAMRAHPNWHLVDYHGVLSADEIPVFYTNALAGLVLLKPYKSYREALPIKLFEYMAAALPVVCSDFMLWRGIVENGQCGLLVNQDSPEEVAEAINRLAGDSSLVESMAEQGRAAAENRYSWQTEFESLIRLYACVQNQQP